MLENFFVDQEYRHRHPSAMPFPLLAQQQSFAEHIEIIKSYISQSRIDLTNNPAREMIITANSNFEYKNSRVAEQLQQGKKIRRGIILLHGLLDSPCFLQDLGHFFAELGFLARGLLLPGCGTVSADLWYCTEKMWTEYIRQVAQQLLLTCDEIYLCGISIGSTISLYTQSMMQDPHIKGLILFVPALNLNYKKIILKTRFLLGKLNAHWQWAETSPYINPVSYFSYPINAAETSFNFMERVRLQLESIAPLNIPIFMALSEHDETIDNQPALQQFHKHAHLKSKLLYYATSNPRFADPRIKIMESVCKKENIISTSHISLTVSPENYFLGRADRYPRFNHYSTREIGKIKGNIVKGATVLCDKSHKTWLQRVTYNPYFNDLLTELAQFVE
ncbi:MAG: alpha/beta hydrolase [Legionellales bacterium]|nr:alpha/beta hydrolase [Legionellales bacterium]